MAELRGNVEDVRFDFDAASLLMARFRSTAEELESQIGRRAALARTAQQEWRGIFAGQFEGRMNLCVNDARALAEGMRRAITLVEELVRSAREEQARRVEARRWIEEHKASNPLEWVVDKVDGWFTGPDFPSHLVPQDLPAQTVPVDAQIRANRE